MLYLFAINSESLQAERVLGKEVVQDPDYQNPRLSAEIREKIHLIALNN